MYSSLERILEESGKSGQPFWKVVQAEDCHEENISEEASFSRMAGMYASMKASVAGYENGMSSASGLVGKEAGILHRRIEKKEMLAGDFVSSVMEKALKVAACNACMRRIVAAPTAGSCGVLPAVLISYQEKTNCSDDKMVEGLYVAAGIGGVIGQRASLSGAQGGCQAEIGSASAMAAGALAYLDGGGNMEIVNACALALKGLLGLACDPVAGLVEVPCVKRNVIGAVNAVTSCDMARAGIVSKIPADEVIDAMHTIGAKMPVEIRETGIGGLAGTKTGQKIAQAMKDNRPQGL